MKKIVGVIKPFILKQTFFTIENGNKIDTLSVEIKDIPKAIVEYANENQILQIDLSGPKQYTLGLIKNIEQYELNKYEKNKLTVNLI